MARELHAPRSRFTRGVVVVAALVMCNFVHASADAGDEDDTEQVCTGGQCSGNDFELSLMQCEQEAGVDYPGDAVKGDLKWEFNVHSADKCCELCKEHPQCKYWTWATLSRKQAKTCWLKNKKVKPYRTFKGGEGLISGEVLGRKKARLAAEEKRKEHGWVVVDDDDDDDGNEKTDEEAPSKQASNEKEAPIPMDVKDVPQDVKDEDGEKKKKKKDKKKDKDPNAPPSAKKLAKAKAAFDEAYKLYKEGNKGDEAVTLFSKSATLDWTHGNAHMYIGFIEEGRGRWQQAIAAYEEAIRRGNLTGNNKGMTHNNLGLLYRNKQSRHDDAEKQYLEAIEAARAAGYPRFWHPHKNLARLWEKNGRAKEAQVHMDIVADLKGDDALRFYSGLLLPYVYEDEEDIEGWRRSFKRNIRQMAKRRIQIRDPFAMEGVPQYYLSYHGRNDAKINAEISELYRASTTQVAFTAPHVKGYSPPAEGQRVRVGFFSYYFRDHSVSKMIMGLFKGLDQSRFYTVMMQIGGKDHITDKLQSYCSKFVHLQGSNLEQVQNAIAMEALDVLVIAEIGMDPHSYAIAHGRYAPVQVAMHGHASTTGISSLDYYVSYAGFSEPQAQSHYSETLVILPGQTPLTLFYDLVKFDISPSMFTPEGVASFKRKFRIPTDKTVYACLQTIFKVSPQLDVVAQRILRADDNAVVLFKELPMTDQVGKQVVARLRKTLTEAEMKRVKFLPPLNDRDYRDTFKIVDVIFDSFPFGGHTSSMDAFSAGVPVVTLPTDLMSGRCTQGFYRFMGIPELITSSIDEYVATIVKLGTDPGLRASLSRRITAGLELLKTDQTSVRAWADFLLGVVHGPDRIRHLLADPSGRAEL